MEPEIPKGVIPFEPKNQYMETESRMALAKQLVEEGRTQEAIVVL